MSLFIRLFQACLIVAAAAFVRPDILAGQTSGITSNTIKIGLLIQDSSYASAVNGAELAVRIANSKGGFNNRHFELVVRSMEGPWGTGSKQAVNLIFEEGVWALLGSHDGRNAHLVEQAATKSQVVFLSAWSGDPTLSQAFVPWFFNCVPNDNQQAAALIDEIYNRKYSKIVIVHDNDYDSQTTLKNFLKSLKIAELPEPVQLDYQNYTSNLNVLAVKTIEADPDCIMIFCNPSSSIKCIQQFRQKKINKPLFGSLELLNENELSSYDLEYLDNHISVTSGDWSESEYLNFRQEFRNAFKKPPGLAASFAFDGMNLLIEAIIRAGSPDREKIQESIKNIRYNGVTGIIQFDDKGNRLGKFEIMKTKNGVPVN